MTDSNNRVSFTKTNSRLSMSRTINLPTQIKLLSVFSPLFLQGTIPIGRRDPGEPEPGEPEPGEPGELGAG